MADAFKQRFVPTLDGEELQRTDDGGLCRADGTPVPPERDDEVVYVNADKLGRGAPEGGAWWRELDGRAPEPLAFEPPLGEAAAMADVDVANLLRALADAHEPRGPIADVDAGFFHRTLIRWMGLAPDDDLPAARAPAWDYGFWKAELVEEGVLQGHAAALTGGAEPSRVKTWSAIVWRGESQGPERYRYWVAFDELGYVAGSGWLSAPPDLLGEAEGDVDTRGFVTHDVEPALLERLLSDPEL